MQTFYSHGKLLLTAEYIVLDGAMALAVPSKFGQSLKVTPINEKKLYWKSFDINNNIWFEDIFSMNDMVSLSPNSNQDISKRLHQILTVSKKLNANFLKDAKGFNVVTELEFSRNWGLGTSSTLINNIASWADIDAYKLLELTFQGSGYDIACAQNDSALTYQIKRNKKQINPVSFNPEFKEQVYFIHLNKKQNSRQGISTYNQHKKELTNSIEAINKITLAILKCDDLKEFEVLITEHEEIISNIIKRKTVKKNLFNDYSGAIKSLGAWGGDFIMATGDSDEMNYFRNKGYSTIFSYNDLLL